MSSGRPSDAYLIPLRRHAQTLRFAARAKLIKCRPVKQEVASPAALLLEISALKTQLHASQSENANLRIKLQAGTPPPSPPPSSQSTTTQRSDGELTQEELAASGFLVVR